MLHSMCEIWRLLTVVCSLYFLHSPQKNVLIIAPPAPRLSVSLTLSRRSRLAVGPVAPHEHNNTWSIPAF